MHGHLNVNIYTYICYSTFRKEFPYNYTVCAICYENNFTMLFLAQVLVRSHVINWQPIWNNKNHTSNITKSPLLVLRRSRDKLIAHWPSGVISFFRVFLYTDLTMARK